MLFRRHGFSRAEKSGKYRGLNPEVDATIVQKYL